jgi:anti-sigma factor RsiW
MCPNGELLSAYLDGEIPSPWKEKLAAHVDSCESCRMALDSLSIVGARLAADPLPDFAPAQARILAAVESGTRAAKAAIWTRRVSLPLPLAAAAAALVVVLALAYIFVPQTMGSSPAMANVSSSDILPVSAKTGGDITDLIRYLDSQDAQVTITVQLPNEAKFGGTGEPELMKASDIRRSNSR